VLKRLTLFLVIFSLPFQLGYHLWLPETYVKSFKIDYLAPTLYLTDIFILLFLVLNYRLIISTIRNFIISFPGRLLIVLIILNLWTASFSLITVFAWLKLLEYLLLFIALKGTKDLKRMVVRPFSISLGIVILLALTQFLSQSSLGGIFYYLGEREITPLLSNVAKINHTIPFLPSPIMRPYSTFSHPNSLAGYLLVSFVILSLTIKKKSTKFLLALVLMLTFSKAAILSFVIIQVVKVSFARSLIISILLSLAPLAKDIIALPAWLAQSFTARHYLLLPSLNMISDRWIMGVGLRRFIPAFSEILPANQISYTTLQPVHNTFLLMLTELGALGVIMVVLVFRTPIANLIKRKETRSYLLDLAGIILMTGSLDHYWWTLPQNQLIIVLAFALIARHRNELSRNHH